MWTNADLAILDCHSLALGGVLLSILGIIVAFQGLFSTRTKQ